MTNLSKSGSTERSDGTEKLITQLKSARELVKCYFDPPACRWDGRFHRNEQECRQCGESGVCAWVFAQDPEPDLKQFAKAEIVDALMFATGFLEGSMLEAGHETNDCGCAVCAFVRENHSVICEH